MIIVIIINIINNIIKYMTIYKKTIKKWIILRFKFHLKYIIHIILSEEKENT
jgi:hypothetical protein